MFMTSLFLLPHMFFHCRMCSWLMLSSCVLHTLVWSSHVSSSCLSARKKNNCLNNRLSRFEQFRFLCWAVDFFKKVLHNRVSSYCNLSTFKKFQHLLDVIKNIFIFCILNSFDAVSKWKSVLTVWLVIRFFK
jgi:hypothetical protein